MNSGLESMHLFLEVGGLSTKVSLSAMSTASSSSLRLLPLARGPDLLERREAPVPQGRMFFEEELEGVAAVSEKVTEELEAASLAE